jgi:hypothetical protein
MTFQGERSGPRAFSGPKRFRTRAFKGRQRFTSRLAFSGCRRFRDAAFQALTFQGAFQSQRFQGLGVSGRGVFKGHDVSRARRFQGLDLSGPTFQGATFQT